MPCTGVANSGGRNGQSFVAARTRQSLSGYTCHKQIFFTVANDNIREIRTGLKVHDLKRLVRRLPIPNRSSLKTKDQMVEAISDRDNRLVRNHLRRTWIDNHGLGAVLGTIGLLTMILFVTTWKCQVTNQCTPRRHRILQWL